MQTNSTYTTVYSCANMCTYIPFACTIRCTCLCISFAYAYVYVVVYHHDMSTMHGY